MTATMSALEILPTFAETTIAFAGFAGLLVILRQRDHSWERAELVGLGIMLGLSLGAFFFSLIPLAVLAYGFTESTTWATCSSLYAVYQVGLVIAARRASRGALPRLRASAIAQPLIAISCLALLLLCATTGSGGFYISVLILQLVGATFPLATFLVLMPRR